ncbi:MAG: hypothetical protein IT546_15060 [Caulobacteraceae bacterium]|nr:hypothetical protein [Caulobacteraceae bacterium]
MSAAESEAEAALRRLVAALSQGMQQLQLTGESISKAELVEALAVAEAAAHRLLAELRNV